MSKISKDLRCFLEATIENLGQETTLGEAANLLQSSSNETICKMCKDFGICVSTIGSELEIMTQVDNNTQIVEILEIDTVKA